MEKRKLGNSKLYVNPVGLGCMGFSHGYGAPMEKGAAVRTLREACEIGYDFLDTAEAYYGTNPDGTISYNEELVGEAVKGIRDKVVIATKMGVSHNADRSLGTDSSPETVAETMAELIKEGKIRYWGISEVTEEYLRRANDVCPVTAVQNRYSMMARWHETIFPVCEELNVAYVAFSPMANGFLTGKYTPGTKFDSSRDYRADMPQYTEEGYEKAKELLDMLTEMAAEKNATMGQLSLAWMINKKPYIVPIPGSRKPERLKENFEAGNIILTKDEITMIDSKLDTMDFEVFGGHSGKSVQ